MKRGKDEEKSNIGPLFPRLHVNDAGKGGPRAPPRNKMALYEQLTIPSSRYNSSVRPRNTVTITNTVASASASQGISRERSMYFPSQQPSVPPSQSTERATTHFTAVNSRLSAPRAAQTNKPSDDVDFMVPVFSHQGKQQCNESTPRAFSQPSADCNDGKDMTENCGPSRQNDQDQDKDESTATIPGSLQATDDTSSPTMRDKSDGAFEACARNHGCQGNDKVSNTELTNLRTQEGHVGNTSSFTMLKNSERKMPCMVRHTSGVEERSKSSREMNTPNLSKRKQMYLALPDDRLIRADDRSEAAVADPVIDIDITPDDVVSIIGLKQFWKARRAIANQQRLFAIQVFELHRLIKVQKLIAESPELLIKSSAFISRRSLEAAPTPQLKKLCTDLAVKPIAGTTITKHKEVSLVSDQNKIKDSSAVDTVPSREPSTIPSPQTVSTQPLAHPPFPTNSALVPSAPPPAMPASDVKMLPGPWPFPQTANQQWLVPVMSPSEGLIYKPYPAHALPGCGGCGPMAGGPTPLMSGGLTPLMGNPFIHQQACGVPPPSSHHHPHYSSHHLHHQAMGTNLPPQHGHHGGGVLPYASGHNYFPPFKMPHMISSMPGGGSGSAVDQMNYPFSGSNLNGGDAGQGNSGPFNQGPQQRGSCNDAGRRRHSDMLGSTASSPSEKVGQQGGIAAVETTPATITTVPVASVEERENQQPQQNALNLFPTTPLVGAGFEGTVRVREEAGVGRMTQVIRVVPHNARTAPESVARIFQCIQDERSSK